MIDVAHPGGAPGSMTITQSRTSWGLEIGRHRFSVTRTREARTVGAADAGRRPQVAARPAWPLVIGTFVSISAFGLFVVGAIASEPLVPRHHSRYSLSLPVPARKAVQRPSRRGARKPQVASARGDVPAWRGDLSGPRFDAADEPYVMRAMQAGDFQEWLGSDGQRRFLNAGPEQADGDRRCRDLALLIRHPDGSSRTRTARRCAPLPASARTVLAVATPASRVPTPSDVADLSSPNDDAPAAAALAVEAEEGDRGIAVVR